MEVKGTIIDNIQCYTLTIQQRVCLFISKPDLSKLKLFNKTTQKNLMKNLNFNETVPNIKIKLDLSYLKQITQSNKIHYILLTSYKQFIVLPYLYKKLIQRNPNLKIFATHIMHEIGRIYLNSFYNKTKQFDQYFLSPKKKMTYQEESFIFDTYYQQFDINYQFWNYIFSKDDLDCSLSNITKVNYGQILEVQGIKIQGYASGNSLGGAIWLFQLLLTKEKILFVKEISAQKWRSFKHVFSQNQKKTRQIHPDIKNVDFLIFANKNLLTHNKKDNEDILHLLKMILKNIQNNQNSVIIFEDQLQILDIIGYLYMEMRQKFHQLFIENSQFSKMVNYANTYVQFLSDSFRSKIHQDPPQYPYQSYMLLKDKGFAYCGSMTQIAQKQKIPLKQLILRSTPFLNFKPAYTSYLEGIQEDQAIWYNQNHIFNEEDLKHFVFAVNPKKIVTYSNITNLIDWYNQSNVGFAQYFRSYKLQNECCNYYLSKNISQNMINRYECVDSYIMAYPVQKQFLHLNSKWTQQLSVNLKNRYRIILNLDQFQLKTNQTQIWIQDYKIFIRSKNAKQVKEVLQILQSMSKTLKLK